MNFRSIASCLGTIFAILLHGVFRQFLLSARVVGHAVVIVAIKVDWRVVRMPIVVRQSSKLHWLIVFTAAQIFRCRGEKLSVMEFIRFSVLILCHTVAVLVFWLAIWPVPCWFCCLAALFVHLYIWF